jgi:hypothetical protein
MERALLLLIAAALAAGCQSQNPFAAFGPSRVPAPTTHQTPPYYPPTATTPLPSGSRSDTLNQRLSVSAEGISVAPPSRSGSFADPNDRSPIRVVENPEATARLAAVPAKNGGQTKSPATPTARPAAGSPAAPQNFLPGIAPKGSPQSNNSPSGRSPAFNRMRSFSSVQPATGDARGELKSDAAVVPASYQQAAPGFVETTAVAGQWRAR